MLVSSCMDTRDSRVRSAIDIYQRGPGDSPGSGCRTVKLLVALGHEITPSGIVVSGGVDFNGLLYYHQLR